MNTDKVYTSFLLKITDELIPQDEAMKNLTTNDIISMIKEELDSDEFFEYIMEGAYGEYIPYSLNDTESIKYFKPVEYHISIPSATCIRIECVYLKKDTLYVQYTILDNPIGKFVYDNLKAGKLPCFAISHALYVDEETNEIIGIGINKIDISAFINKEDIVEMV